MMSSRRAYSPNLCGRSLDPDASLSLIKPIAANIPWRLELFLGTCIGLGTMTLFVKAAICQIRRRVAAAKPALPPRFISACLH